MKYIRIKDNSIRKVYAERITIIECENDGKSLVCIDKKDVIKQADTIEELCDEFVSIIENLTPEILVPKYISTKDTLTNAWKNRFEDEMCYKNVVIYGAIWTDKGLQFVARMNDKGELELL